MKVAGSGIAARTSQSGSNCSTEIGAGRAVHSRPFVILSGAEKHGCDKRETLVEEI